MHPVLVLVPGFVIKALALAALLSGPIAWGVARFRGRSVSSDDALMYAWFALVSVALFVLGAPAVARDGLGVALRHGSTFVEPWRVVPIYSYGVLLATGILMGCFAGLSLSRRIAIPSAKYWTFCAVAAATALLGARGLYLIVQWKAEFVASDGRVLWERVLYPRANGFVVYGGFISGVLGVWAFAKRSRTLVWQWTDIATVGMPLGLAFGRLGCFLAGCDFGMALSSEAPAWLERLGRFPRWPTGEGSPAWWQHTHAGVRLTRELCEQGHGVMRGDRCVLPGTITESLAVHPTQLYELVLGLALFAWQRWLWPRRRFDGQVSLSFMVLYGLARSGLELVRDDVERGTSAGLTTSQWIGLTSAAIGVLAYGWRARTAGQPASELATVS
jgi:phosphatidylglycerol:prolipoprotein diacylglycerol transferase